MGWELVGWSAIGCAKNVGACKERPLAKQRCCKNPGRPVELESNPFLRTQGSRSGSDDPRQPTRVLLVAAKGEMAVSMVGNLSAVEMQSSDEMSVTAV